MPDFVSSRHTDFPPDTFVKLIGKTITGVAPSRSGDEGVVLLFEDGSAFEVSFAGGEGEIKVWKGPKA